MHQSLSGYHANLAVLLVIGQGKHSNMLNPRTYIGISEARFPNLPISTMEMLYHYGPAMGMIHERLEP
jgi:hypothetical protein